MPTYAALPFFSAAVAIPAAFAALRAPGRPGALPYAGLCFGVALYSLGHGFELLSGKLALKVFWDNLQFHAADAVATGALLFAWRIAYPEQDFRWQRLIWLAAFPLLSAFIIWTEGRLLDEGWIRTTVEMQDGFLVYAYGAWMWLIVVYDYSLLLIALGVLLLRMREIGGPARRRLGLVALSISIPVGGSVLTVAGLVPYEIRGLDITPITFCAASLGLAYALFRDRILDLAPVVRARVFEEMQDAVLVFQSDCRLIDFNPAARRLLEDFTDAPLASGVFLEELSPQLVRSLEEPESEARLENEEGEYLLLAASCSSLPLRNGAGVSAGRVLTLRDVTAEREATAAIAEARERAEEASAAKSRFLAHMSHEIRTPMNAILGAAELLDETALDDEQRRMVRVFRRAGQNLLHMLNDLLDISRIEAGRMELRREVFSPAALIRDVESVFSRQQPGEHAARVQLRVQTLGDLPSRMLGDVQRLTQILMNLCSNALKFTQDGEVVLELRRIDPPGDASLEDRNKEWLEFRVRDTGPGISAEQQARIFEPFLQAEQGDARRSEGAGLGLAITRQLTSLMGGVIELESRPGEGSVFRVRVPLERADEASEAPATFEETARLAREAPRIRVLVAEDVEDNRFLIQRFLRDANVELDFAEDGARAVELFRAALGEERRPYDLALLDIQMPELDGYAAARAIRACEIELGRTTRTPVLALSAYAMETEKQRALDAGMDGHIAKPVRREELLRTVLEWAAR